MTDDIKIRQQLDRLGEQRATADANRRRALRNIANLVPRAVDAGIPKSEIADRTGLSRQTIHTMLDRPAPDIE